MNTRPRTFLTAAQWWNDDNAFMHSSAVSFCTMFSIAPLSIIAVTVAGIFLGRDEASKQLQSQFVQLVGQGGADAIKEAVNNSSQTGGSIWATVVSALTLVFSATTVFAQLQSSLNTIWRVKTKPSKSGWVVLLLHRLISFAMVVTLGFLLLVSLVVSTAISGLTNHFGADWAPRVAQGLELVVSFVAVSALFALVFKFLPDVRLGWKDVVPGAVGAAVLFTVGRFLIALYLSHSNVASIYGAAGSLVALLVWVYYSCAIMFYGVELIRARLADQKIKIVPKETAVLVTESEVDE